MIIIVILIFKIPCQETPRGDQSSPAGKRSMAAKVAFAEDRDGSVTSVSLRKFVAGVGGASSFLVQRVDEGSVRSESVLPRQGCRGAVNRARIFDSGQ